MKLRLAAIVFLVAVLATGLTWLSFQPLLVGLVEALRRAAPPDSAPALVLVRAREALPLLLALDLLLVGLVAYAILWLAVARPVQRLEAELGQLERLDLELGPRGSAGPLLARVEASLRRTASALLAERTVTHQQLEDLRLANARITRAQAELVTAERLATVGRLAAGVAHEVGNPLSGILGYLSLLRGQAAASPETREYVERIETEVHRINGIVRGLLDLGRPPRPTLAPVEVAPLAETAVRLVAAGPDFQGVEVTVDVTPGLVVLADAGPLSQVLINLLLNAAQAMGGRGALRLEARAGPEASVRIDVLDTGPGIPPEVQSRLFEPFFTTKPGGKGTGLGLAISQSLVRAMGGTLEAGDAPEGGGRFSVRLPRAAGRA
jgi:two-component system NtrC family sensor kinase